MKEGLPIYHVDRTVIETGKLFGDEAHIIYVNSQIHDESALGKLMYDFYCTDAGKMNQFKAAVDEYYSRLLTIVSQYEQAESKNVSVGTTRTV